MYIHKQANSNYALQLGHDLKNCFRHMIVFDIFSSWELESQFTAAISVLAFQSTQGAHLR